MRQKGLIDVAGQHTHHYEIFSVLDPHSQVKRIVYYLFESDPIGDPWPAAIGDTPAAAIALYSHLLHMAYQVQPPEGIHERRKRLEAQMYKKIGPPPT